MHQTRPTKLAELLSNDPALAKMLAELKTVFSDKFGEDSEMYQRGIAVFEANALKGGAKYGIPPLYTKYWKPYRTNGVLHHITTKKSIGSIEKYGLEPRDPSPRPWAGMKAVYMGEPSDSLYAKSEQAVLEHVRKKGENPVLIQIKTNNQLYKSTDPRRTFQVIAIDPIKPEDIVGYQFLDPTTLS